MQFEYAVYGAPSQGGDNVGMIRFRTTGEKEQHHEVKRVCHSGIGSDAGAPVRVRASPMKSSQCPLRTKTDGHNV